MVHSVQKRKIVKPLSKGQITIPAAFREALGIEADTLLSVSLVGHRLEIVPLHRGEAALRQYTEEEVSRFLEEDKLASGVAEKIRELLSTGAL